MKKIIFSVLLSTRLMAFLFIAFAASMAAGTFIEDAYNTDVARKIVYNSWWFSAIMLFFVINFIGNIKRYQLYKKEKWATLLLHLSFIFILLGAFVTRYISYEGMMPIREGETENIFYSDKTFLTVLVDGEYKGEMKRKSFSKNVLLTPISTFFVNNNFSINESFNSVPFEIEYTDFVMNTTESFEANDAGQFFMKLVESSDGERHEHYIREGEVQNIHNVLFAFNKFTQGAINISKIEDAYTLQAPFEGDFMRMIDKFQGKVEKDTTQVLMLRSLYNLGGSQFVLPEPAIKGNLVNKTNGDYKDKSSDDALTVLIKSQGKEEKLTLTGSRGKQGVPQNVKIGKLDFTLFYGSKIYNLPFSIKLDDFIADKYPGTDKSYSAFKSKLEITDSRSNKVFKDSVFMNNILDYDGHRFFQAGFDPDEKGTNLSVNHDFWGTWITYFGYFLLYFALMAILFNKNTRFADLKRKLENVKLKKSKLLTVAFLFFSMLSFSQHDHSETKANSVQPDASRALELILKYKVSEEQADAFGKIVIQDAGRFIPINTFSSKLLRKVSKSDSFEEMNSDQVLLSMTQFPEYWYNIPIIYIKRGNDSIRKIAGIDKEAKYAKLINFFDENGKYKLEPFLEKAYSAAIPNQFEKDFIETDKKINLLYSAIGGQILKVFPVPNDANNKWVSYLELNDATGTTLDTIKNVMPFYLDAISKSSQNANYKLPTSLLIGLTKYQKLYGSKVMPSDKKIQSEVLYNAYDIFKKLHYWYMFAGILMLIFCIIQMFYAKKWVTYTVNGFHILIVFFFALHFLGLVVRWYISGHAPWSDAYESMIYVSWATMFFGLAFDRKSKLTVASAAFVVSMILMVAHWNWMDPTIGNLQPVLNSYWLMIHVAVIVASYGPFTLAMMLGLVSLFLMIFTTEKNKDKMKLNIQEITYINELALTVGLVMLTIGNFLGGQWANES
ncbi:cytochrome c biogenesis protein CcsA, partial [uncultured Flavobacterium sp.]|uniref:cytochrome c biogenesis protein n=1 Tax=uncultured Flavobacterium sp. TaxID=165435 RepID=UPI0030CA4B55